MHLRMDDIDVILEKPMEDLKKSIPLIFVCIVEPLSSPCILSIPFIFYLPCVKVFSFLFSFLGIKSHTNVISLVSSVILSFSKTLIHVCLPPIL